MSRRDDRSRLLHMLDHAREALAMVRGQRREDLDRDRQLNLALVRLLEVVGEAAARVEARTQARLPDIPWPQVIGMRNRLIHGYDEVDFDILWEIVSDDLPAVAASLERFLATAESGPPPG